VIHNAEDVDFSTLEKFDLVVSNNVLEHISDVERALTNLNNAVSRHGIMIHSCANYSFPFEPHFGIPLLPGVPNLTSRILPKSITQTGLWKSLNFIKLAQVKRNVRRNGMACVFRSGTMSKSVRRLQIDEKFAERHRFISWIVSIPILFKFLILTTSLPKRIATPMDFLICFPDSVGSSNVTRWKSEA
jgi:SAM-dependent methyltransferase